MPVTTLKPKIEETASSKVKPKIDTVRLEQLITQCLLNDVPLSLLTESYDISYKQMGLLINMTRGFDRQTFKLDHTFSSFSYESIPEDYFAIPHVLPEEKHYNHEKVMELFAELEEIKKTSVVSIDTNFIKAQIQKQKEKLASYDESKIKNIQGFINEFDSISSINHPTQETILQLLNKYNLSVPERENLNKLYEDYLNDQDKLLRFEQELIRQQQQEKERQRLERRYKEIREELVIHNIKLVNWCIRKFFNSIPLPKEDAQSYGIMGLVNAINQFEYKRGYQFSTYAVPAIVHTIQRNFKDLIGYEWRDYIKINAINYYRNLMKTESGSEHTPTAEELANMGLLDMSASQIRNYDVIERYGKIEPLSSVRPEYESEYPSTRRYEMPMTQEDYDAIDEYEDSFEAKLDILGEVTLANPAEQAYSIIVRNVIYRELGTLTLREQMVIEQIFGLVDGRCKSLEETAKIFNVHRERIRQIMAKGLRKLRHPSRAKHLKDFLDMDFVEIDPLQNRPQRHIDVENLFNEYYSLSELGLDEQTILAKIEQTMGNELRDDKKYYLEKLHLVEESIISLALEGRQIEKIRLSIYNHYGILFSEEYVINILNRNKAKSPETVPNNLQEITNKKM